MSGKEELSVRRPVEITSVEEDGKIAIAEYERIMLIEYEIQPSINRWYLQIIHSDIRLFLILIGLDSNVHQSN